MTFAYFPDISPIIGRFVLSLAPADPKTWIILPFVNFFVALSATSMAWGVWAKSTITRNGFVATTSILPGTPWKVRILLSATSLSTLNASHVAARAARMLYRLKSPSSFVLKGYVLGVTLASRTMPYVMYLFLGR